KKAADKLEERAKNLLTTNLVLSFPISPLELLVEEKKWLKYDMGIENIYDRTEPLEQIYYFVQVGVERWLEAESAGKTDPDEKLYTSDGKPIITSVGHAKQILVKITDAVSNSEQRDACLKLLFSIEKNILANKVLSPGVEEFVN